MGRSILTLALTGLCLCAHADPAGPELTLADEADLKYHETLDLDLPDDQIAVVMAE